MISQDALKTIVSIIGTFLIAALLLLWIIDETVEGNEQDAYQAKIELHLDKMAEFADDYYEHHKECH